MHKETSLIHKEQRPNLINVYSFRDTFFNENLVPFNERKKSERIVIIFCTCAIVRAEID